MMIRGYEIAGRTIALILGIVGIVAAILLFLNTCQSNKHLKAQNRVTNGAAGASIRSGAEATNTIGNVMANDTATDTAVAAGQAQIHAAPQGQKGKVTRKVACGFRSAANRPECKEGSK